MQEQVKQVKEILGSYQKVKTHVRENKKVYIAGAGGVVVGATGLFFATGGGVQIVDSFKLVHVQWKSPNTYQVALTRRGHPGNIVLCIETGEKYASQARAATANSISPTTLSQHLNGMQDHVNGLHFERLGEAVA